MIPLAHFIVLGAILFCLSMAGIFLNRKNVIILLMSIELMLLSVNLNFVAFSRFLGDTAGQVFVFFILTVAAAEAAIGLAILVVLFRSRQTINVADLDTTKDRRAGTGERTCGAPDDVSDLSRWIVLAPLVGRDRGGAVRGLFARSDARAPTG